MPWLTGAAADRLLREWERTPLDVHHTTLSLWHHRRDVAIQAVLAGYDFYGLLEYIDAARSGWTAPRRVPSDRQNRLTLADGCAEACRWLLLSPNLVASPISDYRALLREAAQFLAHGRRYAVTFDSHVSYSRAMCTARTDPDGRIVQFDYNYQEGSLPAVTSLFETAIGAARPDLPVEAGQSAVARLRQIEWAPVNGQVVIRDPRSIWSWWPSPIQGRFSALRRLHLPRPLDGPSMERYLDTLKMWSETVEAIAFDFTIHNGRDKYVSPTPIYRRRWFIDAMQRASGLAADEVVAITDYFSLQPGHAHRALYYRPLVGDTQWIGWSTRMLTRFDENEALRAICRTPATARTAETFIGERERDLVARLSHRLQQQGYVCVSHRSLRARDEFGEVDLMAWTRGAPNELLLIEAKAALAPRTRQEMHNAGDEIVRAQAIQLPRIERILSALGHSDLRRLSTDVDWSAVKRRIGLVVPLHAGFSHNVRHDVYPVLPSNVAFAALSQSDWETPTSLWTAARLRPWLHAQVKVRPDVHLEVRIGDVRYRSPAVQMLAEEPRQIPLDGVIRVFGPPD
jgi:hypothetical protein